MNKEEFILLVKDHKGKVFVKKTIDDGYQVMLSKNDIVGYITEKDLTFALVEIFTDLTLALAIVLLSESQKGVSKDA